MTEIKHVSFDVWGTLITANPMFALRRTELIANAFQLDVATVKKAYTETKRFVDSSAEDDGIAFSTDAVYAMLFDKLGLPYGQPVRDKVRNTVELAFLSFPPIVHHEVDALGEFLKERGVTMSIGSNSNFISGIVMFPFLQDKLNSMFDFGVFSDLEMHAKPNTMFFDRVVIEASKSRDVFRDEILHVGDNQICDGIGAANSGMQFAVIENPGQLSVAVRSRFL